MSAPVVALPDLPDLTAGLNAAVGASPGEGGWITSVEREANPYAGSSRSEILTARRADGRVLRLFCKYEARDSQSWSDVAYEVEVYRQVLLPLNGFSPRFYGSYTEPGGGRIWLVVEYLDGALTVEERGDVEAYRLAARALGRFHAAAAQHVSAPMLKRYDLAFYEQYVRSTVRHALERKEQLAWLTAIAGRFCTSVAPLLARRRTVTHGDFYPNNILYRAGWVCPIDWEMAGVDVGEMDLACLTDGCSPGVEAACEREYREARWPEGVPVDFERVLTAARICLCFQSMGAAGWSDDPQPLWYGRKLRVLGERLGLVPAGPGG
jgi:aminoglycoside phosphotransferase (APT) family kinase protein